MTAVGLDPVQIEQVVTSDEPSDSGSYREVWFFGDVVIKRDDNAGETNRDEMDFYSNFDESKTFDVQGHQWRVRLPQTAMVGEYLVMERVRFPKLETKYSSTECNFCEPVRQPWGYAMCQDDCFGYTLFRNLETFMSNQWNIWDTHSGNFMYDILTRTIWFIDFAQ